MVELPAFHLKFPDAKMLELWKQTLIALNTKDSLEKASLSEQRMLISEEELSSSTSRPKPSSPSSSFTGARSITNASTEYSEARVARESSLFSTSLHVPVDIVVVIPISSSMHGLKITLLRDMLRFLVSNLGDRDRLGLVTFGSSTGAVLLAGLELKSCPEWDKVADSIRAIGVKSPRADLVEGANAAMDLLMQRRAGNPLASILIVSDSSTSESESIDFVVSRAEAAKWVQHRIPELDSTDFTRRRRVTIYCFGLGLTHRAEAMIELASRTRASYTYVKDWMMLRECIGEEPGIGPQIN